MPTRSRTLTAVLPAILAISGATLAVSACATDNGSTVHGPTFGPLDERDGGGTSDGAPSDEDASGTPDATPGDDAGGDAGTACAAGTVAVLAGTDTALSGAAQSKGGAWAGAAIAGGAAKSKPAVAAFGAGFVGVTRGIGDALEALTFSTSWGARQAIGTATTIGPPALAVAGTKAHVAYLSGGAQTNKFFRAENGGAGFDAGDDPVQPPAGTQSFGPSAPGLAAVGDDLVFLQDGSDNGLYVQSWTSAGATWGAAAPVPGAGTMNTVPPALVGVEGAFDLVAVYVRQDKKLASTTRAAGAWTDRGPIADGLATTVEAFSLARTGQFSLLLAFRGEDGKGYYSRGTIGGASVTWTNALPIGGGGAVTVDSAPAVAKGVCGDDAVVVYAQAGTVRAVKLRGNAWTTPETVTGATGSRVGVATR